MSATTMTTNNSAHEESDGESWHESNNLANTLSSYSEDDEYSDYYNK